MAIKKRTPQIDAEREAAIAAFGAGATAPAGEAPPPAEPTPARTPRPPKVRKAAAAAEPTGDVPSTSLVRWADEDLPRAVQRIAAAEDRSFQKTMLLLIRRGVDAYDAD